MIVNGWNEIFREDVEVLEFVPIELCEHQLAKEVVFIERFVKTIHWHVSFLAQVQAFNAGSFLTPWEACEHSYCA